jgi:hypothetical protein
MPVTVAFEVMQGWEKLAVGVNRYEVVERLASIARGREAEVLAFAVENEQIRFILDTDDRTLASRVARGLKIGTSRQIREQGVRAVFSDGTITVFPEHELEAAVIEVHRVFPGDPLATPWTSHRDLLGLRQAEFFDAWSILERVDPAAVHRACSAEAAPVVPGRERLQASMNRLVRIAAGVLGMLPANRSTFRLVVHLGRALGYAVDQIAAALQLTSRRIRQLFADHEPLLEAALLHVADPRLGVVP